MKSFFLSVLMLLFLSLPAFAGSSDVTLAWDPPEVAIDVTGYRVFQGSASGVYTVNYDAGTALTFTVVGLVDGTYYFAVVAYNIRGQESSYSNEVNTTLDTTPPKNPRNLKILSIKVTVDTRNGTVTNIVTTGK
jgi:hypothetical protein